jgi:hypothetical protein
VSSYTFKIEHTFLAELVQRLSRNPTQAVLELVQNSYDADATRVLITFLPDGLAVEDDGGMGEEQIRSFHTVGGMHDDEEFTPSGRRVVGKYRFGRLLVLGAYESMEVRTRRGAFVDATRLTFDVVIPKLQEADVRVLIMCLRLSSLSFSPKNGQEDRAAAPVLSDIAFWSSSAKVSTPAATALTVTWTSLTPTPSRFPPTLAPAEIRFMDAFSVSAMSFPSPSLYLGSLIPSVSASLALISLIVLRIHSLSSSVSIFPEESRVESIIYFRLWTLRRCLSSRSAFRNTFGGLQMKQVAGSSLFT